MARLLRRLNILTLFIAFSGCATPIADMRYCDLIPSIPGDACQVTSSVVPLPAPQCTVLRGATCDNFLTSDQTILDGPGWLQQISAWNAAGQAVTCTPTSAIASLKKEIENLCSHSPCDYQTTQLVYRVLDKMQDTADATRRLP